MVASPMPSPIALTDSQLDVITAAAQPLAPQDRGAFLQAVAEALQRREVGDGLVARACAEVQRRFFDPPMLERAEVVGKFGPLA
jgi:hypothetical protein